MNKDLVLSLQSELERSRQKVKELEEQLRWEQLENHNQITIKEAKILELKKLLNTNDFRDELKTPMRQVSLNDLTRRTNKIYECWSNKYVSQSYRILLIVLLMRIKFLSCRNIKSCVSTT